MYVHLVITCMYIMNLLLLYVNETSINLGGYICSRRSSKEPQITSSRCQCSCACVILSPAGWAVLSDQLWSHRTQQRYWGPPTRSGHSSYWHAPLASLLMLWRSHDVEPPWQGAGGGLLPQPARSWTLWAAAWKWPLPCLSPLVTIPQPPVGCSLTRLHHGGPCSDPKKWCAVLSH